MALYAISDLHLAFTTDKPMDIFGEKWAKHDEKIKNNWFKKIKEEDTVLIAGDVSWSMNSKESKEDLDWIDALPGKKIISKGNHDYWWNGITRLNSLYENTKFLQNNFYTYKDYAICGSRGWILNTSDKTKGSENFRQGNNKIKIILRCSSKSGYTKIIVMIHYLQ